MRGMGSRGVFVIALACIVCAATPPANAEWSSDLLVYLWASGIDGRVGAGGVEGEVDVGFSDVLDDLQFGFMGGYSGSNGRWALQGDLIVANLGATRRGEGGVVRADVDVDMTVLEADLGYEVNDRFRLFAGARYLDLSNKVEIRVGDQRFRGSGGDSWVDPVVGMRWVAMAGERWSFRLRGDVGGFGVGSDLSWNAVASFVYRFSDRISVGAGYRILDIDYEEGRGRDRFLYNTQMFGVVTGVIFSF